MGRCNDSTTQRVCFFWDGSQGLSFEKRQVPGQLHGSDQADFLLFFLLEKMALRGEKCQVKAQRTLEQQMSSS